MKIFTLKNVLKTYRESTVKNIKKILACYMILKGQFLMECVLRTRAHRHTHTHKLFKPDIHHS